jgi:predicted Zn-dependent protease
MSAPTLKLAPFGAHRDGAASAPGERRIFSRQESEAMWQRVRGLARGGGETRLHIIGDWSGELRWARNRVTLGSDRRKVIAMITRVLGGHTGEAYLNQLDDASLEAAVRYAELLAGLTGTETRWDFVTGAPPFELPKPLIWSDATYNLATEARAQITKATTDPAEAKEMLAAGYLEVQGHANASFADDGGSGRAFGHRRAAYVEYTTAQCSTTVRDKKGSGSGWAGLTSYDWGAIDYGALAERSLQKALASRDPVALEPGRYTVILEPQAVHDLMTFVIEGLEREGPERMDAGGVFHQGNDDALQLGRSKLGLKVTDARITISHDPMDPQLGVIPWDGTPDETPYRAVTWIDKGVLTALADDRSYALRSRNANLPSPNSYSFRMTGGETSVEEMIKSTKRGLLVTRFSNTRVMDWGSLLATGVTRDGLWLVENGAITKAVKNLRFTESPMFVLNSLEQLGVPVPVFRITPRPITPAIAPPLKARDFSFTSTIDAI